MINAQNDWRRTRTTSHHELIWSEMSYDELRQKYRKIIRQIDEILKRQYNTPCLNSINQRQLGGPIGIPLRGSWPIWRPLEGSEANCLASDSKCEAHSGPYFDLPWPPPRQPGQVFWSRMTWIGVPHIVQHVLCSTLSSGGYFRHFNVSKGAICLFWSTFFIR